MIKTAVKRWDAVDVKMEDGEKRFGYVVDIADDALMVDFGNSQPLQMPSRRIRQPRIKPYTRLIEREIDDWLWEYHLRAGASEKTRRGPVTKHDPYNWEAVIQLTPHAPYVWYPARVLAADERSFAVVELLISERRKEEHILPYDHVRRPYSFKNYLDCRPVWTAFRKERIPVPADFILNNKVQKLWNKERPCSKIIKVEDGILYYLEEDKPKNELSYEEKERKMNYQPVDESIDKVRPLKEFLADILADPEIISVDLDQNSPALILPDINTVVPPEILVKIFRFLTTENQAKARQVCHQWNVLLHLPDFVREVHIDVPKWDKDVKRKFAACLYNALLIDVQKIVLTGSEMWTVLEVLPPLVKARNTGPISTLVLRNKKEWFDSFCNNSHDDAVDNPEGHYEFEGRDMFVFKRSLRGIFNWSVMENVDLLEVNCNFAFRSLNADFVYPMASNMLDLYGVTGCIDLRSPDCAGDWWGLLEKCCPRVDPRSSILPKAVQSWKSWSQEPQPYFEVYNEVPPETNLWLHVYQMLEGFEKSGPRTPRGQGASWGNLGDWDMSGLNPVTLAVLDTFLRKNYHPETGKFALTWSPNASRDEPYVAI